MDARMMESVYMRHLKCLGHCGRVGSSPTSRTIYGVISSVVECLIVVQVVVGSIPT